MNSIVKKTLILLSVIISSFSLVSAKDIQAHKLQPVTIDNVRITGDFWKDRYAVWTKVTVFDVLDKFEKDGALRNFDRVAGKLEGKHDGPPWYDGLIYETIRGASDLLISYPDAKLNNRLEKCVKHIVDAFAACPDGYMMTYTLLDEPDHRWGLNGGNLRWQHDVYNAGALVEAGIHYYRATGNADLLKVAVSLANHMTDIMGEAPKKNIVPAHSLPEESFVSLYSLFQSNPQLADELGVKDTGREYLDLVEFWMAYRGNHSGGRQDFSEYAQDHMPVFEQPTIEGHAVRATLMCAGLTAAANVNDKSEYVRSSIRLWDNMVGKKMHISGGVGAYSNDEKFGPDYVLPNDAYLETCAAVGAGFFHHNMNLLVGDAKYADELERVLFNNILNGVSIDGDQYYYQNPLVSHEHHRWQWHPCPCCPPMFLKFVGSLPGYIYSTDDNGLYINQFVSSTAQFDFKGQNVKLTQQTEYPANGNIILSIDPGSKAEFTVFIRIPGWSRDIENPFALYSSYNSGVKLKVNGKSLADTALDRGYVAISREWQKGDKVELVLPMSPRRVYAHDEVEADKGLVALQSGPLLYCLENLDNPEMQYTYLPDNACLALSWNPDICGGVNQITAKARITIQGGESQVTTIKAIPFFCQDNRFGGGSIKVWLPRTSDKAEQIPVPTIANKSVVTSSHCFGSDTNDAVNDGLIPADSNDHSIPRHTWWDHKCSEEWLQYDFDSVKMVSSVSVYWWDDTPSGGECTLPEKWSIEYIDLNGIWKPVEVIKASPVNKDCFNVLEFNAVSTTSLRLKVKLKDGFSGGVLEWQVK